jgi:hypothetical protein
MLRSNEDYYNEFNSFARVNLGTSTPSIAISERRAPFRDWITKFDKWNEKIPFTDIEDLRRKHNARYSKIVKSLQEHEVSDGLKNTNDVACFVLKVRISNATRNSE